MAYTFQIYYDFSGYSDMAIGLAKMFGFDIPENFNYPYISKSISEFWRRWHISLGTWFRDYVYIPLGGSRVKSKVRLIFNLFVVWLCTGLWHGANWTFVVWGIFYFVFITFEKLHVIPERFTQNYSKILYTCLTFILINVGWIIFRAENLNQAVDVMKSILCLNGNAFIDGNALLYLREFIFAYICAIIFSFPLAKSLRNKFESLKISANSKSVLNICYDVMIMILFVVVVSFLVKGSYNPFIYFNF